MHHRLLVLQLGEGGIESHHELEHTGLVVHLGEDVVPVDLVLEVLEHCLDVLVLGDLVDDFDAGELPVQFILVDVLLEVLDYHDV